MNDQLITLDPFIRHGYAQVGDVRLHYVERGSGDKMVLLLHGFPECWYSWRHQLIALSDRYRVVALDMRGYNLSDKPARVEDYKVNALVDDVLGLLRHLGAREAAIIGHDWGAVVAWTLAQKYPQYVWKLAALQVPPSDVWLANMTLRQALRSWYMLFFQLPRVPEWWISADDFAALVRVFKRTARPGTFTDADIAIYKEAWREKGALTGAVNYYRANFGRLWKDFTWLLSDGKRRRTYRQRIRVPTLFIYGERDFAIAPETVRGVGDYVDAPYREVRIAKSNHWVQQEAHVEVNAALAGFLNDESL